MGDDQDKPQCAAHTSALLKLTDEVSNLSTSVKFFIQSAEEREIRRDERASKHSADIEAIRESQDIEVKYWRLGRRVMMWAGLPAIIAWLAVIAKYIKVNP